MVIRARPAVHFYVTHLRFTLYNQGHVPDRKRGNPAAARGSASSDLDACPTARILAQEVDIAFHLLVRGHQYRSRPAARVKAELPKRLGLPVPGRGQICSPIRPRNPIELFSQPHVEASARLALAQSDCSAQRFSPRGSRHQAGIPRGGLNVLKRPWQQSRCLVFRLPRVLGDPFPVGRFVR